MILNRYYNKNFIVGGVFVVTLFLSMTYWIAIRLHNGMAGESEVLFYAFMMVGLVFVTYMGTKEPIFVSEYENKFVIRYLPFREKTIMFDDIVDYRYPVSIAPVYKMSYGKRKGVTGYRILLRGNEIVDLYDTFIGMDKLALRWNLSRNIPQNVGKYIPGDYDFSFSPDWRMFLGWRSMLVLLVVYVPAIRRMIDHPSSLMLCIMIPIFVFTIYVLCRPMTKFIVKEDQLIMKNCIVSKYSKAIPLKDVDWISINDRELFIKVHGIDITKIPHMLSDNDKRLFSEKLQTIGIYVLC